MSDSPEKHMNGVKTHSLESLDKSQRENILDQVLAVEKSAWPDELEATRDKFISRLEIFPAGFVVAEFNDSIKGMATSQVVEYDPERKLTWNELTDNGYIRRTHNNSGNALYVVSVAVADDAQGLGLGSRLVEAEKDVARRFGKKFLFLGARVPGYQQYCDEHGEISVEDYLKVKNQKGETFDPEIRFYERRGLKPVRIIPNFEPDPASRDFGVVMLCSIA